LTLLLNRTEKVKSKSLEWLLYLLLLIGPTQVPRVIFFFSTINQTHPARRWTRKSCCSVYNVIAALCKLTLYLFTFLLNTEWYYSSMRSEGW